jgi:hypothetical protein
MTARTPRAALLLTATVALALPAAAGATTGPGYLLRPPTHIVPQKFAARYPGQYIMRSVDPHARIRSSALFIEYGQKGGFLVGGAQFYGYDVTGQQTSWVGTLYDFNQVRNVVHIDVVGPGGTPVLGRFALRRGAHGSLSGTVTIDTGTWRIAYRRLPGAAPPPQQVVVAPPAPKPKPGWGSQAGFVGRYRATTTGTGIFGPVIRWWQAAKAGDPQLTAFMRTVRKGQPLEPSGILSLHTAAETDVYYLTNLKYAGDTRTATVTGGSFDGPVLGRFSATSSAGGLKGALVVRGVGKRLLRLTRFTTNPHP